MPAVSLLDESPYYEEDWALPKIPNGWILYRLGWCGTHNGFQTVGYSCSLVKEFRSSDDKVLFQGAKNPRSAVLGCIKLIEEREAMIVNQMMEAE